MIQVWPEDIERLNIRSFASTCTIFITTKKGEECIIDFIKDLQSLVKGELLYLEGKKARKYYHLRGVKK